VAETTREGDNTTWGGIRQGYSETRLYRTAFLADNPVGSGRPSGIRECVLGILQFAGKCRQTALLSSTAQATLLWHLCDSIARVQDTAGGPWDCLN